MILWQKSTPPLSFYPIRWDAIKDTEGYFTCHGIVDDDDHTRYPAFAVMIETSSGVWEINNGVYLSTGGTWTKFGSSGPDIGGFVHLK